MKFVKAIKTTTFNGTVRYLHRHILAISRQYDHTKHI
ncbi:MAG: hypothetical protein ACI9T7_000994 [Oleiphilaceae bacterium]|jgi:hypothetical protein